MVRFFYTFLYQNANFTQPLDALIIPDTGAGQLRLSAVLD